MKVILDKLDMALRRRDIEDAKDEFDKLYLLLSMDNSKPETVMTFTREELSDVLTVVDLSVFPDITGIVAKLQSLLDRNPDTKEFIIKPKNNGARNGTIQKQINRGGGMKIYDINGGDRVIYKPFEFEFVGTVVGITYDDGKVFPNNIKPNTVNIRTDEHGIVLNVDLNNLTHKGE